MEERKYVVVSGEKELLKMFQKDVGKIPVLTREEEAQIARKACAGDRASTDLLIESNLRFVLKVVFKFWYPGLPLMDMVSEGCKGLIMALKTFNPEKGVRFITYAESSIRQRVIGALRDYHLNANDSLDDPVYDDDEEVTLKDLLISESTGADERIYQDQVRHMLSALSERERTVIILRFWHNLTLDDVGIKIGLKKERVRQIEARSLRKMRWYYQDSFGVDHGETVDITGVAGVRHEKF